MRGANFAEEEEALLSAARSGPEAFTAFYRRFERSVLRFFVRATGRADLAADLTAETFARVLESIGSYDPAKGELISGCSGSPATCSGRATAAAESS